MNVLGDPMYKFKFDPSTTCYAFHYRHYFELSNGVATNLFKL